MPDQNNAPERIWLTDSEAQLFGYDLGFDGQSHISYTRTDIARADRAAPEGQVQCCMCGRKDLSTIEGDGGEECQLWDGRWTCSRGCYDKACMIHEAALTPPPACQQEAVAEKELLQSMLADAERDMRQRAADACAGIEVDRWDKWRDGYDMLDQGASDGAGDCVNAILALPLKHADREAPQTIEPIASRSRHGDWMQTASGIAFWPVDPRPEDVRIYDIAHSLSNMCRYGGHCTTFYSVAQHSVLVSRALPPELKMWGLLHDASEAYVVDVPRPLKPFLTGYREAEDSVMAAIADAFDLCPRTMPSEVKRIDNAILADEATQIMGPPPRAWTLPEPPLGIKITPVGPEEARQMFLAEYAALRAMKGKSDVD